MNRLFERIPLPAKLALIAIVPVAFIVYFSFQLIEERKNRIELTEKLLVNIDRTPYIVQAVDALQGERWFTVNTMMEQKGMKSQLDLQRAKVDRALERLKEQLRRYDPNYEQYTMINMLVAYREMSDNKSIPLLQVREYYTNMIFKLWTYIPSDEDLPFLKEVKQDTKGQRLIMESFTYLAWMRGSVYILLSKGTNTAEESGPYHVYYALFNTAQDKFMKEAPPLAAAKYKQLLQENDMRQVMSIISDVATKGENSLPAMSPEQWARISSGPTSKVQQLQFDMLDTLKNKTNDIYQQEQDEMTRGFIILAIIIIAIILLLSFTMKSIANSLRALKNAAERIALGETGLELRPAAADVIGSLTRSINVIDQSNQEIARAADAIGRGEFGIHIAPRSQQDLLGNAIVNMKRNLERFTSENEEKVWIQTGISRINDHIRGEKDLATLSREVLIALAGYLDIRVGILYSTEKETLVYQESYGASSVDSVRKLIPFGETLVGEAAQSKQTIYLQEVPTGFMKVVTATGSTEPAYVLIVPLIHNNQVHGVAELGSFAPFSDAAMKLVNQVSDHIAIAMQTAVNRTRLQELLEQTQSQAEELQVQHNELENANTELEAQSQKLQASEEELRVQQEELLQANKELEEKAKLLEDKNQLIVETNLDMQKKAEELALSTKYKSEFLANMSHELRTPLNSILLLSRLLSENSEKNLNSEQVEYAKVINTSGQGLLGLIDEILDLSKIEAGKMTLEYHDVSIQEVIRDMSSLFGPLAKEKGIELKLEASADVPPTIITDKMRLEQVLRNLLSNSLKFTPKGSITLRISMHERKKDMISFSVKDTGIGIAKDKQQIVFEAFQQEDGSTRRKFGGTGLGLSISRELGRLLGGEIKLESEPGKGSEFTLTIPVAKPEASAHEKQHEAKQQEEVFSRKAGPVDAAPGASYATSDLPADIEDDRNDLKPGDKSILVVEDDVAFAKALMKFSRGQGYKVVIALRGDLAMGLAEKFKPRGILLDIQLPVMDGWQVMDELKKNPATRNIPVHIMSSLESKKESISRGAVDFITKPFAFEQMHEVLKRLEHVLHKEAKKVLIIEENTKHAEALSYFLESYNISSEVSGNLEKVMTLLQEGDTDCVILDSGLPDQHAYEMLEDLKNKPGFENIPILLFTGKHLSKTEEERIRKYADTVVLKTAHSYKRVLDEVALFLHLVEENREKQSPRRTGKMRSLGQVLENKTVMIVDDDVRNIFSLAKALEKNKMKVISATDGKEALRMLEENPKVDAVLMDMMMPRMDGYEATAHIRRHPKLKNIPVIAVTAKAMTGDREKCIQAGASDYISKPVDIDQLLSLLRVWLYNDKK